MNAPLLSPEACTQHDLYAIPILRDDRRRASLPVTPAIQLINVSKRYGNVRALCPVDFSVGDGETVALLGPAGCGKSTLLRIILGLEQPDTGDVRIHGRLLTDDNIEEMRRHMGYVTQSGDLAPHLTVRDNIMLMPRYLGCEEEASSYLKTLLEIIKLPKQCLDDYPCELNGSQRQRLSLVRCLITKPDLLLLDEPMGALGSMSRLVLQTELRQVLKVLRKTVVIVTHDMSEAALLGDRIISMAKGSLVDDAYVPADYGSVATGFGGGDFGAARRRLTATFH